MSGEMQNIQPTEQTTMPQIPSPPPKKQNMLGTEILIIIFFFILAIGILNYFNLLRLSELFPNYLGFLPHKPYEQSQQSNNVTTAPTPPPTPLSLSQQEELNSQAKETLMSFFPTILSPSSLPKSASDISLKRNKGLAESHSAWWSMQGGTLSAILVLTPESNNIVQSYLSLTKPQSASVSAELARITTPQVFSIEPKGTWGCQPIFNTMTYCENFWEEEDGTRRGIGMRGLSSQAMIFFCQHNKESKLYSWKSCAFELKETGVQ